MANGCVAAIRKGCELYGQVKGTVAEAKKTVADVQKTVNDVKNIASEVGGFFGWFKKKPKPSEAKAVDVLVLTPTPLNTLIVLTSPIVKLYPDVSNV